MEESDHIHDRPSEEISWVSIGILQSSWEVEGIDPFIGIEIDIEIGTSDRIDESFVFIFWIEDDHVRSHHERTQYFEFYGK